jgi:hypothetical protein
VRRFSAVIFSLSLYLKAVSQAARAGWLNTSLVKLKNMVLATSRFFYALLLFFMKLMLAEQQELKYASALNVHCSTPQ